jgi:hypothetical protein
MSFRSGLRKHTLTESMTPKRDPIYRATPSGAEIQTRRAYVYAYAEGVRLCVAEHRVRTSDGFGNLMVLTIFDLAYYALFVDPDYNFRRLRFTLRARPAGPGRQMFMDVVAVPLD